jgi:hypothetical protein
MKAHQKKNGTILKINPTQLQKFETLFLRQQHPDMKQLSAHEPPRDNYVFQTLDSFANVEYSKVELLGAGSSPSSSPTVRAVWLGTGVEICRSQVESDSFVNVDTSVPEGLLKYN